MLVPMHAMPHADLAVWTQTLADLPSRLPALTSFAFARKPAPLSWHPAWLTVLHKAFGYEVFALEARVRDHTCGYLPLALVDSFLFGKFLVSLPYLSSNGVLAQSSEVETKLISRAVELADELGAKHLELRQEKAIEHPALNGAMTSKVHMRLALPGDTETLWKKLDTKVRNQVRKGEKPEFNLRVEWGGVNLLAPFYEVLSRNMRDLGTPVYAKSLFEIILATFPTDAELCLVWQGETPVASAMLLHGAGITEVPTASSLREFNHTCCNMLMYRHLVDRAIARGQTIFDFGRSTLDGPTFKFKKQWGAVPHPAVWQYHLRDGDMGEMRPDNPRYAWLIRQWQKLPVKLTQLLGPPIVRGIP